MAQYFFHLWTGEQYELDTIGLELPDIESACVEAYRAARDLCSEAILIERNPAKYRFEIADEAGRKLLDLPFSEILGSPQRRSVGEEVLAANIARVQSLANALKTEVEAARRTMAESRQVLARSRNQSEK